MRRRDFITFLGGTVAWPLAARAQQSDRTRRIGVLMSGPESDPQYKSWFAAFVQGLRDLGWTDGRNIKIESRWAAADQDRIRAFAAELVGVKPEVILAVSTPVTAAVRKQTSTIPIVFLQVADPIGSGLVADLAHPGSNITGFTNFEYTMSGKWLELLKEIAPRATRVVAMGSPQNPVVALFFHAGEALAPSLGIQLTMAPVKDVREIERAIGALANESGAGLIVLPDLFNTVNRHLIIQLAARHNLPAIYPFRVFATSGGLLAYGVDTIDSFRQAPAYIDRILKGAKPGDLPIQQPIKFELVINLKTAKALGLTVPPSLLARADEVIE